jgi:WD40 repeat protein
MNNPENPSLNNNNNILKSNSNINNSQKPNNYSQFSLDKNYYLCCPVCNNCVPHIEKFGYDNVKRDFNIDYICPCIYPNHKTKAYFSKLITENKPKNICPDHKSKELLFFCKECNIQICKLCKEEEHQNHEIAQNNTIISKEDAEKMKQIAYMTRSQFQGYELIEKLYNSYCAQNNENSRNFNGESNMGSQINVFKDHNINEKLNNENDIAEGKIIKHERIIEESFGYKSIYTQLVNKNQNPNPINSSKNQYQNEIGSGENYRQNDEKNKFNNNNNSDDNNKYFYNDNNNNKDIKNYIERDFINESNNINDKNNTDTEPRKYINTMTLKGKDKNDKIDKIVSLIQLESGDIATGSYDSQVRIWDIKTGQCILSFYELGNVLCLLEFKPDQLLAGTSENNIGLWYLNEIKNKTKYDNHPPDSVFNFSNHTLYVNCLVKYNDKWFASASNDTKIIMWDYFKREQVFELLSNDSDDSILSLIKLNDGKLCSGGEGMTIKIWDVYNRRCIKTLRGHEKWIRCLCQLSDGTLLSGGDDQNIKIWTNYDFDCIGTLSAHTHAVRTICQIDNKYFASGSFDNRIIIWDIQNMKYCSELRGHSSNVICIIKLKDNRLCSCSTDGTVKIWE